MTDDKRVTSLTHYLPAEGKDYMAECMEVAFEWAIHNAVDKIVVFTATGDGPLHAVQELLPRDEFGSLQIVGVSPPVGRPYRTDPENTKSPMIRAGVASEVKEYLLGFGIPVIAAHLPFKEVDVGRRRESEWSRVAEAFGIFGGGFALCVQAILVACDAGEIHPGERVIALSADTAIAAVASRTETFLSPTEGLIVEHLICRPRRYNVSRPKHAHSKQQPTKPAPLIEANDEEPKSLPSGEDEPTG